MKFLSKKKNEFDRSAKRLSDRISKRPMLDRPSIVDIVGLERRPDFLCIGTEKAGTTWLWHWMKKHPEIGVPASKELRFFSSRGLWDTAHFNELTRFLENPAETPGGPRFKNAVAEQLRLYFGGLPAYLKIFGNMKEPVVGELSPQYCALPPKVISKIHSAIPDAKIIYMLRDPADRLLSGARMAIKQQNLDLNDTNILRYAADPVQRQLSNSAKHLENYEKFFGKSKVKTVFFDDIARDPSKTFDDVCEFLGVFKPGFENDEMATKVNEGKPYELPNKAKNSVRDSLASVYDDLEKRYPNQTKHWR